MNFRGVPNGLFVLWKKDVLSSLFTFTGEKLLGIKEMFKGKAYYFDNVYSSCNIVLKINTWDHLLSLKRKWWNGNGVFLGISIPLEALLKEWVVEIIIGRISHLSSTIL